MPTRSKISEDQALQRAIEEYLESNPQIREALEVFNLSYQTYASILAANRPAKVTTTSTSKPL